MSKEQPKAPLIPTDQTFSGSGSGAPPLAQKPAGFSRTKEKIELDAHDLGAPGLQPNSADKDNKGGKKGGGRTLKGAQAPAVLNSPAPASAPDANAGKGTPDKNQGKQKKTAGKVASGGRAPKATPALKSALANAPASAPSTTPDKQKSEAVKKEASKKEVEREQSPEEKKALVFSKYFREGKTTKGYALLERINGMPHSDELLEVMPFAELEKFSAELFLKVVYFFRDFEEAKALDKSSGDLLKLGSDFITKEDIPSGCQGVIHDIVQTDIIAKLKADLLAKNRPVPTLVSPPTASSASAPEMTIGTSFGSGPGTLAGKSSFTTETTPPLASSATTAPEAIPSSASATAETAPASPAPSTEAEVVLPRTRSRLWDIIRGPSRALKTAIPASIETASSGPETATSASTSGAGKTPSRLESLVTSRKTPLAPAEKSATAGGAPETKRSAERGGFTFNMLAKLDGKSLSKIFREIDPTTLAKALSTQNEAVRAVFFGALSERAGATVSDVMANLGRITLREVEDAEDAILDVALKLQAEGEITLPEATPVGGAKTAGSEPAEKSAPVRTPPKAETTAGLSSEQLDKLAWDNLAKLSPELLAKGLEGIDFRVLAVAYQDADGISFESVVKKALSPKDADELALDELELTLPNKLQIDEARTKVVTHFREKLGARAGNTVENSPQAGDSGVDGLTSEWLATNFGQLANDAEETGVADPIEALCAERLTANEISERLRLGDANIVRAVRMKRGIPAMTIGVGTSQSPNPEFESWLQGREKNKKAKGSETPDAGGDAEGNEAISTAEKPSVKLYQELKYLSLYDITGDIVLGEALSDITRFKFDMTDEQRKEYFSAKMQEHAEVLKRELPKATAYYKATGASITKLLGSLVTEGGLSAGDEKRCLRFASLAEKLAKLTQEPNVDLLQFVRGADALGWFIHAVRKYEDEPVTISDGAVAEGEAKLTESGIEL